MEEELKKVFLVNIGHCLTELRNMEELLTENTSKDIGEEVVSLMKKRFDKLIIHIDDLEEAFSTGKWHRK